MCNRFLRMKYVDREKFLLKASRMMKSKKTAIRNWSLVYGSSIKYVMWTESWVICELVEKWRYLSSSAAGSDLTTLENLTPTAQWFVSSCPESLACRLSVSSRPPLLCRLCQPAWFVFRGGSSRLTKSDPSSDGDSLILWVCTQIKTHFSVHMTYFTDHSFVYPVASKFRDLS